MKIKQKKGQGILTSLFTLSVGAFLLLFSIGLISTTLPSEPIQNISSEYENYVVEFNKTNPSRTLETHTWTPPQSNVEYEVEMRLNAPLVRMPEYQRVGTVKAGRKTLVDEPTPFVKTETYVPRTTEPIVLETATPSSYSIKITPKVEERK